MSTAPPAWSIFVRRQHLRFATSAEALWRGNFRELSASITRLATLAEGGRISVNQVEAEILRLRRAWQRSGNDPLALLAPQMLQQLDLFDRLQLEGVVAVCAQSVSMADAGRRLFAGSRLQRRVVNDSDRLKKYLARFGLEWSAVKG